MRAERVARGLVLFRMRFPFTARAAELHDRHRLGDSASVLPC